MSSDRNIATQESLKREIKAIQAKCEQICHNTSVDALTTSSEELTTFRINNYIEALRNEIHNSNTGISMDENLLTSQFLIEMKQKTEHVEDMVALTKANIHDMTAEINRLQALIDVSKEATSRPKMTKAEVKPEHVQKAKEKFQMMKHSLHGLIESLFPDCYQSIIEVLGCLMTAKLNENPNGYIPTTEDNFELFELLKDMNIVTRNPYNNAEVKLTYY